MIQERCLRDPEIHYEIYEWTTGIDVIDSYLKLVYVLSGTSVAQWLRCCATNRKVAGSIPNGVIGIFY